MKQIQFFLPIAGVVVISFFAGCIKTYKIAPSETPQGTEYKDHRKIVKNNLRSARVYDQWQTDAAFDVLWLSDETRGAFVDSYCKRRGIEYDEQEKIVKQELGKNKEHVYFYVLADVRDNYHPSLTDDNAHWTFFLQSGYDNTITVSHVSSVTLSPEYQNIFGHRMSKFKRAYQVTFNAQVSRYEPFNLIISSPEREAKLTWQSDEQVSVTKKKKEKLVKDEDYYWL